MRAASIPPFAASFDQQSSAVEGAIIPAAKERAMGRMMTTCGAGRARALQIRSVTLVHAKVWATEATILVVMAPHNPV
jgi:hypothetical protein